MARTQIDIDSTEATLAPNETVSLTLDSQRANSSYITIDGGADGVRPNVYNITTKVDLDVDFGFQQNEILSITRSRGTTHKNSAYGRYMEFELENASDETADYRFAVETYTEDSNY